MSTVADLADAQADGVLFAVALAFRSTPTHAPKGVSEHHDDRGPDEQRDERLLRDDGAPQTYSVKAWPASSPFGRSRLSSTVCFCTRAVCA